MEQIAAVYFGSSWLLGKILLLSYEPHANSLLRLLEVGPGVILIMAPWLAGGRAQTQKVILTVSIRSDCSRQLL